MRVVVFVGGKGVRLRPLTEKLPKPLLPVGSKPILQTIVERLRSQGLTDICLATGYKADLIEAYFADGQELGVNISYTREPRPLGTAGALRLARDGYEGPLLVMNGDLLTEVSFAAMRAFHEQRNADITLAVKQRTMPVRFGVLDLDDGEVVDFREKPIVKFDVYAGIAIVEPQTLDYIPDGERYDIPNLIEDVKSRGGRVAAYHLTGFWLDIGEMSDYQTANQLAKT